MLRNRGIAQLVVCGVTTEVCVNTTVREANDRGFECLVLEDCVASYFEAFQQAGIAMIKAQGEDVIGDQPLQQTRWADVMQRRLPRTRRRQGRNRTS